MKSSLFSVVNSRKLALQRESTYYKIDYRTVHKNPSVSNLCLFIESRDKDANKHFAESVKLFNRILNENTVSDQDKRQIENSLCSQLMAVKDLNKAQSVIESCVDKDLSSICKDRIQLLETCDRVIRNENKLQKRFYLNKIINENIAKGTRHTVFELCSLLDTYSISSKAKFNIALENVSYAMFKSGKCTDLNEVCDYIVEYFLTRDAVITDKAYNGYINVLENNEFIDKDDENLSYVFKSKEDGFNSYANKVIDLANQCEDPKYNTHIKNVLKHSTEAQASQYIDDTIMIIVNPSTSAKDAEMLLNSIYCLPLIGHVSDEFVNYKMEMGKKKIEINSKISGSEHIESIKKSLDNGSLIEFAIMVSENAHNPSYIFDDYYQEETDPVKILEGANDDKMIEDIVKAFKASNEKSPSKFKNMIYRIMSKDPQSIIDELPSIFTIVRNMLYLALSATFPLGPVFGAILFLTDRLVSRHINIKQSEKFLKYLRNEKSEAKKKLEKASNKEKENLEEYIACLDKCIKKVEAYLMDLDDENEELNNGGGDDNFDFGDLDFSDDDDDFNFESSIIESGTMLKTDVQDSIISMISPNTDVEILASLSTLFDNSFDPDSFYNKVEEVNENGKFNSVLNNRGKGTIYTESGEVSLMAKYESARVLRKILNEANDEPAPKKDKFNLNKVKMAGIVFRQKFKDAQGKEKEFWRNIDIATANLSKGIQQALTSDRREAIIKGSIIPSFSKCIKYLLAVAAAGFVGSFAGAGVIYASIAAVGMLGASKILNERERRLLYDEIDTELQVVEKQIQMAENEGDMKQYRFLLNYQKKLQREKYRIKYGIKMSGRSLPELKRGRD